MPCLQITGSESAFCWRQIFNVRCFALRLVRNCLFANFFCLVVFNHLSIPMPIVWLVTPAGRSEACFLSTYLRNVCVLWCAPLCVVLAWCCGTIGVLFRILGIVVSCVVYCSCFPPSSLTMWFIISSIFDCTHTVHCPYYLSPWFGVIYFQSNWLVHKRPSCSRQDKHTVMLSNLRPQFYHTLWIQLAQRTRASNEFESV